MNFAENIKRIIVAALVTLKSNIIRNHLSARQEASGKTIRSLVIEETADGAMLKGRKAFATLEDGRKPGKAPKGFNTIIMQWIKDKGIRVTPMPYIRKPSGRWQPKYNAEQRGLMSLAGAIAHKIKTEGTVLYKDGGRKDIFTPETDQTVKEVREELSVLFVTEIQRL